MKKSVYVLGAGGHAKVVIRTLQAAGFTIEAIFDDDPRKWGTSIVQARIEGPIERVSDRPPLPAIVAIGGNQARKAIVERLHLEWLTVVHPNAFVDSTVQLGVGTVVMAGTVIQPDARVGSHTIINTAASVDHDCLIGDFVHIAPGVHLAGSNEISEGAFLGIGTATIPGVHIGEWTLIGAGSVVIHNMPSHILAMGAPAKERRKFISF